MAYFAGLVICLISGGLFSIAPKNVFAQDCHHLSASNDPSINYNNIVSCLSSPHARAQLAPGAFPLSQQITMPTGATLLGTRTPGNSLASIIIAVSPSNQRTDTRPMRYKDNKLLDISDDNTVAFLQFIGAEQLHDDCCTAVLSVHGSHARLNNLTVLDVESKSAKREPNRQPSTATGIYFIGSPSSNDNIVNRARIYGLRRGVIFRAGLPTSQANILMNSELSGISCDAITFAGYGISRNNSIHDVGYDCGQKPVPVPGAAIYAINNEAGAQITGNIITAVCGNGLDMVNSKRFVILDNKIMFEGYPFSGTFSNCVGGSPAVFVDVSDSTIKSNYFSSRDTPRLGLFLDLFAEARADWLAVYYPLRNRDQLIMAVRLLHAKHPVLRNIFEGNVFVARCTRAPACATGLGLYAGPGTGLNEEGEWSERNSNRFLRNAALGSNIGSVRCGTNLYGGGADCKGENVNPKCNDDDYQHVGGVKADIRRNDICAP